MRYYTLSEITPGMVLGRSINGCKGRLLLHAGKPLDGGYINRIQEFGFSGAYIEAPGFESIDPPEIIDPVVRFETQVILDECFEALSRCSSTLQNLDVSASDSLGGHPEIRRAFPLKKIQEQVNQIVDDLTEEYSCDLPCLLIKAHSQYRVEHATDTMVLSILIGIYFKFTYRELRQLALAALLHDVGKTLLTKPGEQDISQEHPRFKEHPVLGSMIVLESGSDQYTEGAAIRQHHERQDGKGFPDGLIGYNKAPGSSQTYHSGTIYRYAEIISVANDYDILTSGAYASPLSPEEAIKNLLRRSFFEFNSHVVNALTQMVQIFPAGCQVRIKNSSDPQLVNCQGIVEKINPDQPHRADVILIYDNTGQAMQPTPVSLQGDESPQLELVL